MKIVNKRKFVRTVSIFILLISALIFFSKNIYSKVEITYKEDYIYTGDTLWSIAKNEIENNKYFENKDIRDVVRELKDVNNLSNSNLVEGKKIRIPVYNNN